jgi:hypothetical protein
MRHRMVRVSTSSSPTDQCGYRTPRRRGILVGPQPANVRWVSPSNRMIASSSRGSRPINSASRTSGETASPGSWRAIRIVRASSRCSVSANASSSCAGSSSRTASIAAVPAFCQPLSPSGSRALHLLRRSIPPGPGEATRSTLAGRRDRTFEQERSELLCIGRSGRRTAREKGASTATLLKLTGDRRGRRRYPGRTERRPGAVSNRLTPRASGSSTMRDASWSGPVRCSVWPSCQAPSPMLLTSMPVDPSGRRFTADSGAPVSRRPVSQQGRRARSQPRSSVLTSTSRIAASA